MVTLNLNLKMFYLWQSDHILMLEMANVTSGSFVTLEMGLQAKSIVGALHCGRQYFSLCSDS